MHIRRSETVLGTANIERLCEKIYPREMKEKINPFDPVIRDYLSMLDNGYSENDAVMMVMLRAHEMIGSQFEKLLANAKLNNKPAPFIIEKETAKASGFNVDE